MSAPLVVNTRDGACWTRRTVTEGGIALYALADVCSCPEFVMATLAELAERGIVGSADALPMPVGPELSPLERMQLRVDEVERAYTFDTAELKRRIAELEAERHTTNEALDDAVQELRTPYAERARRETHPGRRQAWRLLAQVEESERVAAALLTPEAARSADQLTALMAPTQALREVPDGEHYTVVHHEHRISHDMPPIGGEPTC